MEPGQFLQSKRAGSIQEQRDSVLHRPHQLGFVQSQSPSISGDVAGGGRVFATNQKKKSILSRIERSKRGVPGNSALPYARTFVRAKDRQSGHWEIDPSKQKLIEDAAKRYLAGESIAKIAPDCYLTPAYLHRVLTSLCGTKWRLEFKCPDLNIHEVIDTDVPGSCRKKPLQPSTKKAEANKTYQHGHILHRYLFSRMIRCAHCGYALAGQANHADRLYYRHSIFKSKVPCSGPHKKASVPAAELEDAVMRQLFETFGDPAAVKRAIEQATPNDEKAREALVRHKQLSTEIEKVKNGIQRVVALVSQGMLTDSDTKAQLVKLKEKEQKLEAERVRIDDELAHIPSREVLQSVSKSVAFTRRNSLCRSRPTTGTTASAISFYYQFSIRREFFCFHLHFD